MSRFAFAPAALLSLACLATPASAADPSVDEMIEALAPKPAAPLTRSLKARPSTQPEGKLALQVQFDFGSSEISPQGRELLAKLAGAMKSPALGGRRFRIEGHTDIVGSAASNLRLSDRRAQAVSQFLKTESGIEPRRVAALGMGFSQLADPADGKAAINRRVVIVSIDAPLIDPEDESAGSVHQLKGTLYAKRGDANLRVQVGGRLYEGDVLSTPADSSALLKMDDGASLLVRNDTNVNIRELRLTGDSSKWGQSFELLAGALRYVSGSLGRSRPEAVALKTTYVTLGIRGTDFEILHAQEPIAGQEAGTYVRVNKGAVALGGLDGSKVELAKDEEAYAGKPKPLTRGGKKVPAAMRLDAPSGVFKAGELDEVLN